MVDKKKGGSCKDLGKRVPGRRKRQCKEPETEPSLSGSRDQKEVRVAGATRGRKREIRDQRNRLDQITGRALVDYDTDHPPCLLRASTTIYFG